MNNERRKQIKAIIEKAKELAQELDLIAEDERDAFYNLPEGLQLSERGEKMEENADNLECGADELRNAADEVEGYLEDM